MVSLRLVGLFFVLSLSVLGSAKEIKKQKKALAPENPKVGMAVDAHGDIIPTPVALAEEENQGDEDKKDDNADDKKDDTADEKKDDTSDKKDDDTSEKKGDDTSDKKDDADKPSSNVEEGMEEEKHLDGPAGDLPRNGKPFAPSTEWERPDKPEQAAINWTAVELVKKMSAEGDPEMMYSMGVLHRNGIGVDKDDVKAVSWLEKAAEAGRPEAQSDLGFAYARGKGVETDEKKAVEWFEKAAAQGNMLARVNLAEMLKRKTTEDGQLKDEGNDERALELYTLAADEQDDAHAMFSIAEFHRDGRAGLEKSDDVALEWYRKAADRGHEISKEILAEVEEEEKKEHEDKKEKTGEEEPEHKSSYLDVPKHKKNEEEAADAPSNDMEKAAQTNWTAVEMVKRMSKEGDPEMMYSMGVLHRNGLADVAQDDTKAAEWFQKAAEKGWPEAQSDLGFAYAKGKGVTQDESLAVQWFEKAAAQGNMLARVNLAEMLKQKSTEDGLLREEGDDKRALELYTLAAEEQGDPHAMYSIAEFHRDGRGGLEKSDDKALEWYRKAADKGHEAAKEILAEVEEEERQEKEKTGEKETVTAEKHHRDVSIKSHDHTSSAKEEKHVDDKSTGAEHGDSTLAQVRSHI